jgi:hypothetical protein
LNARPSVAVFVAVLALVPLAGFADDTPAFRPVSGAVIMAKATSTSTLFIWDATPYVTQLVADKVLGDDGLHAIEASAIQALADKAKKVTTAALTLRVLYSKTGAVSPVYGAPTFAGIERVMTISVERTALAKNADAWSTTLGKGTTPDGVKIDVSGQLPPAQ